MPRSATAASPPSSPRRATNVTLPEALLREARQLGINLSQAAERGLATEVAAMRRRLWLEQNGEAIDAYNEYVAQHALPLAAHRQF